MITIMERILQKILTDDQVHNTTEKIIDFKKQTAKNQDNLMKITEKLETVKQCLLKDIATLIDQKQKCFDQVPIQMKPIENPK